MLKKFFKSYGLMMILSSLSLVVSDTWATEGEYKSNDVMLSQVSSSRVGAQERVESIPSFFDKIEFNELDSSSPNSEFKLSGVRPQGMLYFPVKKDEIIRSAEIDVQYIPSPSLLPLRSQLNVYLNGDLQESIPINQEDLGKQNKRTVKFNPLLIKDFNIITFDFIGHYSDYCENIVNSTIWLNISGKSVLHLERQRLHVQNNLAYFPVPFFNNTTKEPTTLPFIFAGTPDDQTLTAASIFASYGGMITGWRGVDYPVYSNQLPMYGHGIVFITNTERPDFLKDYPQSLYPKIEMIDMPHNVSSGKLLIISAPNSAGLITAVKSLVQGFILFNGPIGEVKSYKDIEKRKAYDAPNWISIDNKTTFGSLTKYEGQLTSAGITPLPINLELSLPPDLYFMEGSRINIQLHYRYSKPLTIAFSNMQFLFNDHIVRSYPIEPQSGYQDIIENLPLASVEDLLNTSKVDTMILRNHNKLTFDFQYGQSYTAKKDECTTYIPISNRVEIDPNSTLDFTGLYHFTKMPNLRIFWDNGFPFSKYADLQETTVVVTKPEVMSYLHLLFNFMARVSSQIGYPAVNVDVIHDMSDKNVDLTNKDLLVIGQLPNELKDDQNILTILENTEHSLQGNFGNVNDEKSSDVLGLVSQNGKEGISAILSFASPITKGRTVVALLADGSLGASNLSEQLVLGKGNLPVSGTVTIFKENIAKNYTIGQRYYVGNLPWFQRVWYHLVQSPILLILLCFSCSIVFCWLAFKILKKIRHGRIEKR